MQREKVYQAIDSERQYQDWKWGTIQDHPHEVGGYLTLMRKLLTDAEAAWASSAGDYGAVVFRIAEQNCTASTHRAPAIFRP